MVREEHFVQARINRCTMGETVLVSANISTLRQTSKMGDVLNHQCYLLCRQVRVPVANATPRYATVANRLLPFQKVESRRYMALDSSGTSRTNML